MQEELKVKDLIKALKKMPQDLPVVWADHDHGDYEYNAGARYVKEIEKPDEEFDSEYDVEAWNYQRKDYSSNDYEHYVVIRP